jgi:type IV pilus assembly protein PilY1
MDDFQNNEVVNNITTYTIGFADDQVINDPLMKDTAKNGGGKFLQAGNAAELTAAFSSATLDIFSQVGSAAAVGSTSGSVSSDTRLFQGRFNSGNWSGQLLSFVVQADGSVDINSPEWDAAAKLTDGYVSQRDILTIDPAATPNPVGIAFRWNDLNAGQQAAMNTRPDGTADAAGSEEGQNRSGYIRGSRADEGINGKGYRIRSSLLGDIMNSEPIYVGPPPFDYPDGLESGQTYTQFKRSSAKDRTPVVYVGANDGMLHGFDASLDPSTNGPTASSGQEVIAYIPNKLIPKLTQLTNPSYSHKMFVDGSPLAGDIYKSNNSWATILAGPLGLGGQGIYALDITDPTIFDESNANQVVLWEFADTNDADLGYIYGALNIVRMKPTSNGPWAVVAGNGYNNTEADGNVSASGNAALFIINAETGALIRKIDTGVGTAQDPLGANRPNGLAPSAPIDIDNDNIIDYIYAGDLFGNLWKFDVRSDNSNSWTAWKIFTAVDAAGNTQPITSQVAVSRHLTEDGFMIYFGTGKYLEPADTNAAGAVTQTFYGIWDDLSGSTIDRNIGLHVQTILAEVDNPFDSNEELRVTSDATPDIDWTTDRGWRMDLFNTEGGNINNFGERVIADPVYLPPSKKFPNGRIIFATLIPNSQMCGYGGSGWFMELDPNDGSRLSHPPFDITGEGQVDFSDVVVWNSSDTIVSGKRTKFGLGSGIPTEPKVLEGAQGEFKYGSDTTGAISVTKEPAPFTGRTSWRELLSN